MELDLQHLWVYLGLLVGGGVVYVSLVPVLELPSSCRGPWP